LHQGLDIKPRPFTKLKSVVHKLKPKNQKTQQIRAISSG
ncbi:MAG: hypothetical protein ACJA01_004113, partial [Saprospiraceae bacterium]